MKTILFADTVINSLWQMGQQFINAFPRVFTAIVIFLVGMIISKMVSKAIKKLLEKAKIYFLAFPQNLPQKPKSSFWLFG